MNAQIAAQTARTPGPWYAYGTGTGMFIQGSAGKIAAKVSGRSDDADTIANAAFIVQACNAHDDLVAALREIADGCDDHHFSGKVAKAALAKAGAL